MSLKTLIDLDGLSRFKEKIIALIPTEELDVNVEDMLDNFELDYTSDTSSINEWTGGSY